MRVSTPSKALSNELARQLGELTVLSLVNPSAIDTFNSDNNDYQAQRKSYRENPVLFVQQVLKVNKVASYQADILNLLRDHKRLAVRGPHGIGKSTIASWVVLWAMSCFENDVKVVTTASVWRQLTKFLWPEIRKWAMKADWSLLGLEVRRGHELLDLSLKIGQNEAFAAAAKDPALIEGAHATTIFYLFDESKAIPAGIFDAAEGAFSVGDAYALALSTPGDTSGRFYDINCHKAGYEDWHVRPVTKDEAIAAGRMTPEWAEQRRIQWGENSQRYKNKVLGDFAEDKEDVLIPLSWIEAAIKRWRELNGKMPVEEGKPKPRVAYGIDPAYMGNDRTAVVRLCGHVVESIDSRSKQDLMDTADRVAHLLDLESAPANPQNPAATLKKTSAYAAVDVIGVGAGVYSRLKQLGYSGVMSVNVATKTTLRDLSGTLGFANLRAAIWWALREALDPANNPTLALPDDKELVADLTTPKWWYSAGSDIVLESKDDIRERLGSESDDGDGVGRSPDKGDALALAYYAQRHGAPKWGFA